MSMPKVRLKPGEFAVLTLTEPWASLVVWGEKRFESRGWPTAYRGLVLIQAAKTMPRYAQEACFTNPFEQVLIRRGIRLPLCRPEDLGGARGQRQFVGFRFGCIIGAVMLADSIRAEKVEAALRQSETSYATRELAFGLYGTGPWAFQLTNAKQFDEPLPVRGALGIWTLQRGELACRVQEQLLDRSSKRPSVDETNKLSRYRRENIRDPIREGAD